MRLGNSFSAKTGHGYRESITAALRGRRIVIALTALGLLAILVFMNMLHRSSSAVEIPTSSAPSRPNSVPLPDSELIKPENLTISGLVFFGRKDRVESMHCYLEVDFPQYFFGFFHF